jgi:hypothetical protein
MSAHPGPRISHGRLIRLPNGRDTGDLTLSSVAVQVFAQVGVAEQSAAGLGRVMQDAH